MITTLLWDIDGVFVDTERLHFEAWAWLARHFGKSLTQEEYAPMIGRGSDENMSALCEMKGITGDHAALQSIRREKYAELRRAGIPLIQKNIDLARAFKKEYPELVQAAVSSSRRSDIDENLAAAGLSDFFVKTISFEDKPGLKRKPALDLYIYACEALEVSPAHCLAFEDSENGATAAREAGVRVCMVPTSLPPTKLLEVYK